MQIYEDYSKKMQLISCIFSNKLQTERILQELVNVYRPEYALRQLEAGRFKLPEYDPESQSYPMEWRDLVMMVEGINEDPSTRQRRLRAERTEYHV